MADIPPSFSLGITDGVTLVSEMPFYLYSVIPFLRSFSGTKNNEIK